VDVKLTPLSSFETTWGHNTVSGVPRAVSIAFSFLSMRVEPAEAKEGILWSQSVTPHTRDNPPSGRADRRGSLAGAQISKNLANYKITPRSIALGRRGFSQSCRRKEVFL